MITQLLGLSFYSNFEVWDKCQWIHDKFPPQTAYSCPWLEEVQVQDNRLDSLPASLLRLPVLSILDASNNKLQTVPFAMWTCTSLRELNLSLNMLSDLPTSSHLSR